MHSIPSEPESYQPQELWSGKTWRTLVVIAVLGLFSCWALNSIWFHQTLNSVGDTWHCLTTDCDPSGSAVSWKEQFEVADAEARKVDEEALLILLEARPTAYKIRAWEPDSVLEINFEYVLTSGQHLDVSLLDSNPASSVKTSVTAKDSQYNSYELLRVGQDQLNIDYASIPISPRLAAENVRKVLREKWGEHDLALFGIFFSPTHGEWMVNFRPPDLGEESREATMERYSTFYFVDAHTGDVIVRNVDGEVISTITP